jgi:hypothetical protein
MMGMQMAFMLLRNSDIYQRCANPHLYDRLGQLKCRDNSIFDNPHTPFYNNYNNDLDASAFGMANLSLFEYGAV